MRSSQDLIVTVTLGEVIHDGRPARPVELLGLDGLDVGLEAVLRPDGVMGGHGIGGQGGPGGTKQGGAVGEGRFVG